MQPLPNIEPSSKYQPQELNARHREMIRLHIKGLTNREIAAELDRSESTVGYLLDSDIAHLQIAEMQSSLDVDAMNVAELLDEAALAGAEFLRKIATGDVTVGHALRVRTSMDVLDRTGHGKVTKVHGEVLHGYLGSTKGLQALKENARKHSIIDVTPSSSSSSVELPRSAEHEPPSLAQTEEEEDFFIPGLSGA